MMVSGGIQESYWYRSVLGITQYQNHSSTTWVFLVLTK